MKPRRERDIQAAVLALLRAHGVPAWKVGSGAFKVDGRYVKMGHRGMADIIGVRPAMHGQLLAIEVKAPGKRPTLEQRAFLETVRTAGGLAFVASSCEDVCREMGWPT